ncbi:MAG: 4-hydroxybenzoyl-CoA thioesterase [Dinoroseobacter sp.]|jgi:4-hydroxybenzoyl-CoA thioesterase
MFKTNIKIRFNHVDVAGIVFYPRYYEMLNQVVEEWFEQKLDTDFQTLYQKHGAGVPAVSIQTDFPNACSLGDMLEFRLEVEKLGNSSINLGITAKTAGKICLEAKMTLIYVLRQSEGEISPIKIPDVLRNAMLAS